MRQLETNSHAKRIARIWHLWTSIYVLEQLLYDYFFTQLLIKVL